MTATRQQFCDEMEHIYSNHGVYIGTGNGELTETLTIGQIHQMEEKYQRRDSKGKPCWDMDTRRDLAYIGKCYELGCDMKQSRAGDCSGQIGGAWRRLGLIKSTADYRARDMQSTLCTPISLTSLKAGDLVFDKTTAATHVGVYVTNGNVIESKGRDDGVVRRPLSKGNWVIGGRLKWWEDPKDNYYPKYGGTSPSIITALAAVGEKDTSMAHRKRIAVANKFVSKEGDWKGTAEQNTLMLNTLKKGVLIKCP